MGNENIEAVYEVTETTVRINLSNISTLESKLYSPAPLVLRRLPFRVLVEPRNDKVKRHTSLGFVLECDWKQKEGDWSCKVGMEFRLIAQEKGGKDIVNALEYTFGNTSFSNWGFPEFILWSKLVDPKNGYVVKGGIILELDIKVEEPVGIHYDEPLALKPAIKDVTEVKSTTSTEVGVGVKAEGFEDGSKSEGENKNGEEKDPKVPIISEPERDAESTASSGTKLSFDEIINLLRSLSCDNEETNAVRLRESFQFTEKEALEINQTLTKKEVVQLEETPLGIAVDKPLPSFQNEIIAVEPLNKTPEEMNEILEEFSHGSSEDDFDFELA